MLSMYKDAGKLIRDTRENQNISLEKISKDLHIRITYLQAIENGRPEILPSAVQGRGFIRMTALYLKLDPNQVLAIWDAPSFDGMSAPARSVSPDSPVSDSKKPAFPFFAGRNRNELVPPVSDPGQDQAAAVVSPAQSIYDHIGAQLRERRELLGLPFEEAEKFTNVRAQYLQLLEEGKFGELESSVQARGILYNYANFLNLNGDDIMIQFANALQLQTAARHFPGDSVQKKKKEKQVRKAGALSRFFTPDLFIGVTVIIGVIALAIYSLITIPAYRNQAALKNTAVQEYVIAAQTGIVTPSATPEIPTALPTAAEAPAGALINEDWIESGDSELELEGDETDEETETIDTETPAPMDGAIQVYIEANQRAFLRVTVDEAIVFVGRTETGKIYPFSGNQMVEVETGNASALRIQYNNRNLGTVGNYGEVKKIVFSESLIQTSTPVISPTPTETFAPTYTVQSDVATPTVTITPYIP